MTIDYYVLLIIHYLVQKVTDKILYCRNYEIEYNLQVPKEFYANKTIKNPKWCNGPIRYLDPPGPLTALASFPGSGNTWVRYLLQHSTGFATGSVYLDNSLRRGDFPGEGLIDGSVIAIKTHCGRYIHTQCGKTRNSLTKNYFVK